MEKINTEGTDIAARIVEVQKDLYRVSYETEGVRQEKNARLKGAAFYRDEKTRIWPAIGDYVRLRRNETGDDLIEEVLPRHSWLSRPKPGTSGQMEQGVAANIDYILLVQSLNQNFSPRRMERYLAAAWDSGATPVVILTKADLLGKDEISERIRQMEQAAPGVKIMAVSALTGEGMEQLKELAAPSKTLALVGSSGIGKSTLVNALTGEAVMATAAIREEDGRGRHTTTHRRLISLENGAFLIDTPGMREFGMWNVQDGVEEVFTDVEELARLCRFRDCRHDREKGCAVKAALANGTLTAERFRSWQKLQKEAAHNARKLERMERKQERRRIIKK